MVRKKGANIEETGTKSKIIELILNNKGPIEEAQMRKKIHGHSGNVNRHLHELSEKFQCIELTKTVKKGRRKYNLWDITKIKHLKNIKETTDRIQLNKYEKSINLILRNFGYDINSPGYIYCFIRLYMSRSFFNACLDTDLKSLTSKIRKYYRYEQGFEDEAQIKKLVNECNATYIKGKFNFEMSYERFRKTMEELAQPQQREEIYTDYVWRTFGMPKEQLKNKHGDSFIEDNIEIVKVRVENLINDPEFSNDPEYPEVPKKWIESFLDKFKEKVPELCNIELTKILKTDDEYEDMCQKMTKLLFLIKEQQETFEDIYFNLLFKSFLFQDILNDSDLPEELDFAEKTKKYRKEYKDILKKKDYRLVESALNRSIFNEHEIISEFMAKYKMPSILSKISDDSKEVLRELLELHNYHHLTEYLEDN
ncbi:hypothetical protein [Methanosarcina sp. UBA5]|uniref:hypothetical protein n=1 Tax=Methanosarcina sp. UBA5 TaxID=1915593 RepID=UPI0025E9CF4B|nr:hypothetical protein [Methanosarcina sp. UBA5]